MEGGSDEAPEASSTNALERNNKLVKMDDILGTREFLRTAAESTPLRILLNSDTLKHVFEHLDEDTLKSLLGSVCSFWSEEIGRVFPHPVIEAWATKSIIYENARNFQLLHKIEVLICYENENEEEELLETLRNGTASSAERVVRPCWWERKSQRELLFYVNTLRSSFTFDILLEIIRRSTNLKELELNGSFALKNYSRDFFRVFLGRVGLEANTRLNQTLESLRIDCHYLNHEDFERLQKLKLNKLKKLDLRIQEDDDDEEFCSSLCRWVSDLKSSLEYFRLNGLHSALVMEFEFLSDMENLKYLNFQDESFKGDFIILPLMKKLPNLETIIVDGSESTGVRREDYLSENFNQLSYPKLKKLKMAFFVTLFTKLDCQLNEYIPKMFPNLKILRMSVYSKQHFLACVHDLREMGIEELYLTLITFWEQSRKIKTDGLPDFIWDESNPPSFNIWPKLRKLSVCIEKYRLPTPYQLTTSKIYNMPMENVLPKSLTSLKLRFPDEYESAKAEIELRVLLTLLQGLPRLMHCSLDNCNVIQEDQNTMDLSAVRDALHTDPRLHPFLYFGGSHY